VALRSVGGWRSASLEVGGKSRTTRGDGETETRRERQKTEDSYTRHWAQSVARLARRGKDKAGTAFDPFDPFDKLRAGKLRTGRLRRAEARPVDSTG